VHRQCDRRAGGARLAQQVQHHEVVNGSLEADGCDRDVGGAELGGIGFALVPQHVCLVDEEERGGQFTQLVDARAVWRRVNLRALTDVFDVAVPKPLHRLGRDVRPSANSAYEAVSIAASVTG